MVLKLYNSLSRQIETLTPLNPPRVTIYTCGPTVYDYPHIGNWRSFIAADWLIRTLIWLEFKPYQVMNITDVDDKTIAASQKNGQTLAEFTKPYIDNFLSDLSRLNITSPSQTPKATEYIAEMIKLIETLLDKKLAYVATDGVYFDIRKFDRYHQLANLPASSQTKSRIAADEYGKDQPADFVLWKQATNADGDNVWPSPWGLGRPGWHIECSAMATSLLGPQIDIHTGGSDLIFPHHTNEIAQTEGATDQSPLAQFWFHVAFVNINNQKIAKSLGNAITLKNLIDQGFDPLAWRYLLLTAHYRQPISFTLKALTGAQTALNRLRSRLLDLPSPTADTPLPQTYLDTFTALLNDDLNLPQALALGWDLLADQSIDPASRRAAWFKFDQIFGLNLNLDTSRNIINWADLPAEIQDLLTKRQLARDQQDWPQADNIRQILADRGFMVTDTATGQEVKKSV